MKEIKVKSLNIDSLTEEIILVVSDVHLGHRDRDKKTVYCNKEQFNSFLSDISDKTIPCDRLIIIGDLFDMWRRDIAGVILENTDTINILRKIMASGINVDLVIGNHDYYMRKFKEEEFGYEFTFYEELKLIDNNDEYWFLHGDKFDRIQNRTYYDLFCLSSDKLGQSASEFYESFLSHYNWFKRTYYRFKKKFKDKILLPLRTAEDRFDISILDLISKQERNSKELKSLPGLDKFPRTEREAIEFASNQEKLRSLVFGHTHHPFVHIFNDINIANPGTWVGRSSINNTYIKLHQNEVELHKYVSSGKTEVILSTMTKKDKTRTLISHN